MQRWSKWNQIMTTPIKTTKSVIASHEKPQRAKFYRKDRKEVFIWISSNEDIISHLEMVEIVLQIAMSNLPGTISASLILTNCERI